MWSVLRRVPRTAGSVAALGVSGLVLGAGLVPLPCLFLLATGLDCPFCGGSRMIGSLLRGDVLAALDFNAFALLFLSPVLLVVLVAGARQELGRAERVWPSGAGGVVCAVLLAGFVLAWSVVRNLPFEPFTVLRA